MQAASPIFNAKILKLHHQRAARMAGEDADFLWQEIAARLVDRLEDVVRQFPLALELFADKPDLSERIQGVCGIKQVRTCYAPWQLTGNVSHAESMSESELLPFHASTVDVVLSANGLQWVNDLPGMLTQIRHLLKPDGLMLAMFAGGETLKELRFALNQAMEETTGGICPRISPMVDIRDAASLLQRAGFALPVVDRETIKVEYSHPIKLLHDLRAMGQTNALSGNIRPLRRDTLLRMVEIYQQQFPAKDGGVIATFDILCLTGWKPDASQPKPKPRGSATHSMREWFK